MTSGKIADFGCGAGVISAYSAKLNPENRIFALDVDAFALASTQMTFEKNQLSPQQLEIKAVSGIEDAPLFFTCHCQQSPFPSGNPDQLLRPAKLYARLRVVTLSLAVNYGLWKTASLNYPILIEQSFGQCTVKTDQQGFKVLFASTQKNAKES